jgi:hypothetical protein
MFPLVASQAIALKQARQKRVETGRYSADSHPPVRTVRKGLLRRLHDALVESRRRKADREIEARRRLDGGEGDKSNPDRVS